jgi:hypothetical protein
MSLLPVDNSFVFLRRFVPPGKAKPGKVRVRLIGTKSVAEFSIPSGKAADVYMAVCPGGGNHAVVLVVEEGKP